MGVYIEGMEMPKDGFVEIIIKADGTVQQTGQTLRLAGDYFYTAYVGERPPMYKAVPVPPHGRLIDADALIRELEITEEDDHNGATLLMAVFLEVLKSAPTVIDAEEEWA